MDYLRSWREAISARERLYPLLALVAVIVIGLADVLFARKFVLPAWQNKRDLAYQVASAKKALEEARRVQEASPDALRKQIEEAQATLDEVASAFLSDSQAAEALNRLYQYAGESQVEIASLRTIPIPELTEKGAYDVRAFRLEASGTLPNLVDFISRIEEARFDSFIISNVNITESEGRHILYTDVILYTSPYSSGAVVKPTPGVPVTPTSLAQLEEMLDAAWAANEWGQVIALLEQILAINPDYEDMMEKLYAAHVNYGYKLLGEGDLDGAKAQFNSALEIKPDGVEALAGLQQAAAWAPTPAPVTPVPGTPTPTLTLEEQLAQSLHEPWAAKDWEEVIRLVEQILAINPDYDDMKEKLYAAHVNYGRQLVAEGKLEEAKVEFIRALEVKPDGGEAMAELRALAGETPVPPVTPTLQPQYIIHVVRRGENLFRIALRYGTTVQAIMAANGLTNYTIYVGQQLRIPIE